MSCTKTQTIRISLPAQPRPVAEDWAFLRALSWLLSTPAVCRWLYRRQRGRQQLLELDEHLLDDIGVTRDQAEEIGNKPFWK